MAQLENSLAAVDLKLGDEVMNDIDAAYRDFPIPY
jgi:aryl-alcohol dehydrogenase-like predicted oxidoreductase